MPIRVICIKKSNGDHDNPHTAIESLSWIEDGTNNSGTYSRVVMYDWINRGGKAYVQDTLGNKAYLTTALSPSNTQYVRTIADGTKTDNLLQLPECK